jgi:presenilin-like A22 family membrane protease
LNIWTAVLLLILISIYDIYAVWHAGFMQKMAQYQIKKLKFFTGLFIPYLGKKERAILEKAKKDKKNKERKIKVSVAILGGGDIVFPIILAGIVLNKLGLIQALLISVGATIALAFLFYISKKGKFYPAMPYLTAGTLAGMALGYLVYLI